MLVVSGDSTVATLLSDRLTEHEVRLTRVATADEALAVAARLRPAVVVLAVPLPDRAATDLVSALQPDPVGSRIIVVELAPGDARVLSGSGSAVQDVVPADATPEVIASRARLALQQYLHDLDRRDRLNELLLLEDIGRLHLADIPADSALAAVARRLLHLPGVDFAAMRWLDTELVIGDTVVDLEAPDDAVERPWSPSDVQVLLAAMNQPGPARVVPLESSTLPAPVVEAVRRLGLRVLMRLPLSIDARPLGVLLIGRRDIGRFTQRQEARFYHIARLVSGMIERVALLDDGRRQSERLKRLHETIREMFTTTEADDMLQSVAERAAELLGATTVRIWLATGDGAKRSTLAAGVGPSSRMLDAVGERVFETGQPESSIRRRGRGPVQTHLAIPLKTTTGLQGVIGLSHSPSGPLADDVQQILAILAENLVVVLELLLSDDVELRTRQATPSADRASPFSMLPRSVIHDMMQPVTAALAMLEMLVAEESLTATGQELAHRMRRTLNKVGQATSTDGTYAGTAAVPSAGVRVERVLREAVEMTHAAFRTAGVHLTYHGTPGLPSVRGDADELERVFVNVLVNAREAMAGRTGAVHVSIQADPGDGAGNVVVRIRDTGPGIPESIRGRLFEPDVSTKEPSRRRGLGLTICRDIVERHGGSIELEPAVGEGACFRVTLPAMRESTRPGPS